MEFKRGDRVDVRDFDDNPWLPATFFDEDTMSEEDHPDGKYFAKEDNSYYVMRWMQCRRHIHNLKDGQPVVVWNYMEVLYRGHFHSFSIDRKLRTHFDGSRWAAKGCPSITWDHWRLPTAEELAEAGIDAEGWLTHPGEDFK